MLISGRSTPTSSSALPTTQDVRVFLPGMDGTRYYKNFYILLWMEKLYRSHSHRKESQEGLGMREGREIETQTEGRVRARLYAYLQKPASVYNTTQQETERSNAALLQNKNALCVYFPVHFYTRTNRRRAGGAWGGFGMVGLLLVTGYNW